MRFFVCFFKRKHERESLAWAGRPQARFPFLFAVVLVLFSHAHAVLPSGSCAASAWEEMKVTARGKGGRYDVFFGGGTIVRQYVVQSSADSRDGKATRNGAIDSPLVTF